MPRRPREHSSTGIYHIMLRGINHQRIFHDEADYRIFLEGLRRYREVCGFSLYAYCLMPNHLHLLLRVQEEGEALDKIMRRLGTWYVYRYNRRYERSGPLFDGRYKSEVVEDDPYFLAVLRYIHRNPVKAGLVARPDLYPYSSCAAYLSELPEPFIEYEPLLSLLPQAQLAAWHTEDESRTCLGIKVSRKKHLSDEEAIRIMHRASGVNHLEAFLLLHQRKRVACIRKMHAAGASLRQLVRLTGTSMALVRKVLTK